MFLEFYVLIYKPLLRCSLLLHNLCAVRFNRIVTEWNEIASYRKKVFSLIELKSNNIDEEANRNQQTKDWYNLS